MPDSAPLPALPMPRGVRQASMIHASVMVSSLVVAGNQTQSGGPCPEPNRRKPALQRGSGRCPAISAALAASIIVEYQRHKTCSHHQPPRLSPISDEPRRCLPLIDAASAHFGSDHDRRPLVQERYHLLPVGWHLHGCQ